MKSKIEIENNWREWTKLLGLSEQMPFWKRTELKKTIANEVQWIIMVPSSLENVKSRLEKYQKMLANHTINIKDYDPFFVYRIKFFEWVLN